MNIAKPARESLKGIPKTVPIIEETIVRLKSPC